MTMLIEVAKQALEALESFREISDFTPAQAVHAITALRTAIADAEKQEPVAWVEKDGELVWQNKEAAIGRNLYTKPPAAPVQEQFGPQEILQMIVDLALEKPSAQRQPLTEEQIDDIWNRYCDEMGEASINDAYDIARAVEAAHGIGEKK